MCKPLLCAKTCIADICCAKPCCANFLPGRSLLRKMLFCKARYGIDMQARHVCEILLCKNLLCNARYEMVCRRWQAKYAMYWQACILCLVSHLCEYEDGMQAVAGHICYVLAGLHTQPHGPASQLCLVGADHRTCPRRFATIPALQRSEILEWARSQGRDREIFCKVLLRCRSSRVFY